ncbi:MAG: FtsX-like permease family protein [bacterium]
MGLSFFIAQKYLGAAKRGGFVTATAVISVIGVAIGVLALIVTLAVLNGFETEVIDRIISTNAHVIIRSSDGIENHEDLARIVLSLGSVKGVAPFVAGKAVVLAPNGTDAIFLKGIDHEKEKTVTEVGRYFHPSGVDLRSDGQISKLILGKEVAYGLQVSLGDTVILARAESSKESFGLLPTLRRFVIAGVFDSGMYDYDATMAFADLGSVQEFYGMSESVTGLSVKVKNGFEAPLVAQSLALILGTDYQISDWIHTNRTLFKWMGMEKKVMFIILSLIVVVAAFNIAGMLIMMVMQRTKEIGILRSMGATRGGINRIFMIQGTLIGALGTSVGTAGGLVLSILIDRYHLIKLPGDVYFIETLPVLVRPLDVLAVISTAMVISFIATLYPAWRAAKLLPVEAIKYE